MVPRSPAVMKNDKATETAGTSSGNSPPPKKITSNFEYRGVFRGGMK